MCKGYTLLSIYLDGALLPSNRPNVIVYEKIKDKLDIAELKIVTSSEILSTKSKEELYKIIGNKNITNNVVYSDFIAKGAIICKLYIKRLLQAMNFIMKDKIESKISILVDNNIEKNKIERILDDLY